MGSELAPCYRVVKSSSNFAEEGGEISRRSLPRDNSRRCCPSRELSQTANVILTRQGTKCSLERAKSTLF